MLVVVLYLRGIDTDKESSKVIVEENFSLYRT